VLVLLGCSQLALPPSSLQSFARGVKGQECHDAHREI
jgi:hypothetical protein